MPSIEDKEPNQCEQDDDKQRELQPEFGDNRRSSPKDRSRGAVVENGEIRGGGEDGEAHDGGGSLDPTADRTATSSKVLVGGSCIRSRPSAALLKCPCLQLGVPRNASPSGPPDLRVMSSAVYEAVRLSTEYDRIGPSTGTMGRSVS